MGTTADSMRTSGSAAPMHAAAAPAADAAGIDIGRLIDERPLTRLQVRVVVLCALVVLLDGYDIQTMALAVPSIAAQWKLPPSSFWLAQSAAVIGMGLGSALLAPLGDRVGRRPIIVGFLSLVGLASIATAFAASLTQFIAWRLLTGLGLGASLANATALTSEYMPARRHTVLVTLMFCNVAVGAFAAGFTAPALIGAFGWPAIFLAGGIVPLVLAAALFLGAPESVRLLAQTRPGDARIARVLSRLAPEVDPASVRASRRDGAPRQSVLALLSPQLRGRTLALWALFCLNLFVVYFLISWLPTLLRVASWSSTDALRGTAVFQGGGVVGGLIAAWIVDRGRMAGALGAAYLLAAAALAALAFAPHELPVWYALIFALGCGISGAQLPLYALAAAFYPPAIRATALGWTATVSRLGAASGPMAGGWMMRGSVGASGVLGLLIAPTLACAATVLALARVAPDGAGAAQSRRMTS